MVKRDSYMERLIHSMWNGEIKVITGIRRCGKSVLLFDLFFEYLLSQNVSLLGDNIFYAPTLGATLKKAAASPAAATVFGYYVEDPRPFGVVEFDKNGKAISIEEKPRYPKSNYIVPGLYFYDQQVMEIARALKPSARGELEITDVNLEYLSRGQLQVIPLEKNFTWLDAGTADSLLAAAQTIKEIQDTTGRYVGCLEELGFYEGWISEEQVHAIGDELEMTLYGKYLKCL